MRQNSPLKVIQAVIFSINTYEQDMIAVGNKNKTIKNKNRWNYFHHMPILPSSGAYHRLTLLIMAIFFIWFNETKKRMNKFAIGYTTNPGLHVYKAFRQQVEKFMHTTFGEITQPFIKSTS